LVSELNTPLRRFLDAQQGKTEWSKIS
jgi:hypothetical protein